MLRQSEGPLAEQTSTESVYLFGGGGILFFLQSNCKTFSIGISNFIARSVLHPSRTVAMILVSCVPLDLTLLHTLHFIVC